MEKSKSSSQTRTFNAKPCIIFIAVFVLFLPVLLAQRPVFEFGKVTIDDMDVEKYREKYPEASAVVIGNIGECKFLLSDDLKYWKFEFKKTKRILILNELGVEEGDFKIYFHETSTTKDKISDFRAHVYNIKDGRIRRQRIRQRDGYEVDYSNTLKSLNYTLPSVVQGSLIEYTYTLTSYLIHYLPNWIFQEHIPVEHSDYTLYIPQNFTYRMRYRGFETLAINTQRSFNDVIRVRRTTDLYGGKIDSGTLLTNIVGTRYRWVATDLPSLNIEPYINNAFNYASMMRFELVSIEYHHQKSSKYYSDTWENVMRKLNSRKEFGKYLLSAPRTIHNRMNLPATGDFYTDIGLSMDEIRKNIRWNESSSIYAIQSPEEVLNSGSGNSAEINLLLCVLLRNMHINAHPVVLSTVDHIKLMDSPTIRDLNYVIVAAFDDEGNYVLLDATDPALPIGYLPMHTFNGKAIILNPNNIQEIEITNPDPANVVRNYDLVYNEDGSFSGDFEIKYLHYGSYIARREYMLYGKEYFANELSDIAGFNMLNLEVIDNADSLEPFILKGNFNLHGFTQLLGDEVIFRPLLFESLNENLFKHETRLCPIEFFIPFTEEVNITIKFPEKYNISFIPDPHRIIWGRNFSYDYKTNIEGNILNVNTVKSIQETTIPAERYNGIVEFFDRIVGKNSESVILEKVD